MEPYILRSKAPNSKDASRFSRQHSSNVLEREIGTPDWQEIQNREPMYHPVHLPMFDAFARTNASLLNSMVRGRQLARYPITDLFRPFRAYTTASSSAVLGFDMLNLDAKDHRDDYPIPFDEYGSHGQFSFYITYAFMLQREAFKYVSDRIDLHVLTNGTRFARAYDPESKLRFTDAASKKRERSNGIYVHADNINPYLNTLFTTKAFRMLVHHRHPQKRMRRILLPFQSPGHVFIVGWDRYYDADGRPAHDRVFCMSNSPPSAHPHDPYYATNFVRSFAAKLVDNQIATQMPEMVPRVAAASSMRSLTFHESLPDFDCCYSAIANTLYLAAVENISDDVQPDFASLKFYHHVRNAYINYLDRLVNFIEAQQRQDQPVLLSAEWGDPFVNIRSVGLLPGGVGYDWERGFVA